MGFQHLTPEERSRIASKGGRALWACSEEEKEKILRLSFHSEGAKEKSKENRSEALKRSWESLSSERRLARIEAAAEGVRRARPQRSRSMERYWGGKTVEERHQHYLDSFGSEGASRHRGEAMKLVWSSYTDEEKKARIDSTVNSLESRKHWKETYESLSSEAKKEWIALHLRGRQHQQTEPEAFLEEYLGREYPGEWKYVGASREVCIGGKFPDFININGKKEVLEVLGVYWHLFGNSESKVAHYRQYGFGCKLIWDFECYMPNGVDRILSGA